jgi:hypothetical protein
LDEAKVVFPGLKIASLSAVSFLRAKAELAQALNLSQLRTLKLRNCRGTNDRLTMLADSSETLHLTSFELTKSRRYLDDWELMPLVRFLESFQGLEELSLLCDGTRDPLIEEGWRSILHHCSTLKRFVHHQREVELDHEYKVITIYQHDLSEWYVQIMDLVLKTSLDCIGFCCSPKDMLQFHPTSE